VRGTARAASVHPVMTSTRTRSPRAGAGAPAAERATRDRRWAALVARDASADGDFYYAVATTGVYCRPSCGARTPRPENVSFYATSGDAERAGFRACKRCSPDAASADETRRERVAQLCRWIEGREDTPRLEELAARAGWSPSHTHRAFKAVTGLTPRAYATARRAERMRRALGEERSVTDAIYGAGFGSTSRFYEGARDRLGMTPTRFRDGGRGEAIRYATRACSLGVVLAAATSRGVCAILIGAAEAALVHDLERRFPRAHLERAAPAFDATLAEVVSLVEEPRRATELPLDIRGTAFQERVWRALREVRAGETITYAELAARIDAPGSARAVAGACAANPLAVAVPCHRVLSSAGGLAGYRWGLGRKRALLARERSGG
jgi:AraC family transcriptional regulator, regulatory protein of adaptative response / methylated-DNA-[protein]-cysteine methyltransferase